MSSGRARTSWLIAHAAAVGLRIDSMALASAVSLSALALAASPFRAGRNSSGCNPYSSPTALSRSSPSRSTTSPYAGPASDNGTGWTTGPAGAAGPAPPTSAGGRDAGRLGPHARRERHTAVEQLAHL